MSYHIIVAQREAGNLQPSIELCPSLDGEVSEEYDSTDSAWDDVLQAMEVARGTVELLKHEIHERELSLEQASKELRALHRVLDDLSPHL